MYHLVSFQCRHFKLYFQYQHCLCKDNVTDSISRSQLFPSHIFNHTTGCKIMIFFYKNREKMFSWRSECEGITAVIQTPTEILEIFVSGKVTIIISCVHGLFLSLRFLTIFLQNKLLSFLNHDKQGKYFDLSRCVKQICILQTVYLLLESQEETYTYSVSVRKYHPTTTFLQAKCSIVVFL